MATDEIQLKLTAFWFGRLHYITLGLFTVVQVDRHLCHVTGSDHA